jgi:hypothetical protein
VPLKPHAGARACGSCGALIFFAQSGRNLMPLDAVPVMRAVLEVAGTTEIVKIVKTYTPHFATCPNAASHRRS